jgi:hypothetical protein
MIAAGAKPPREMQTMAWNGPKFSSRAASVRQSRWNWSHETETVLRGPDAGRDSLLDA